MSGVAPKIKVLFIAGSGRSGSTLLERMLGQIDGFCPIGEFVNIWRRGVRDNWLCGCGEPFRECRFWQGVLETTGGIDPEFRAEDVHGFIGGLLRYRYWPFVAWPSLRSARNRRKITRYTEILGHLYHAIQQHSGCEVIVDASKTAHHAFLLSSIPTIDLRVVHLVRDSRAVAYSWTREKRRIDVPFREAYMARHTPLFSALLWNWESFFATLLGRRGVPYRRLTYDDLIAHPETSVRRITAFAEVGTPDLSFVNRDSMVLKPAHSIVGNPDRFSDRPITLKPDEKWKRSMNRFQRALVTLVTLPLLIRFGFLGLPRRKIETRES